MRKIAVIGIIGNSVFLPVEEFHRGGETVEASSVHFEPGGKGFNQAIAAARCGCDVSFMAAVGYEYRRDFEDFLGDEGVHSTLVYKDGSTAFASIVTDKKGSNHVTVYQGVQLCADDVSLFESSIAEADILLLNNEVPNEVNIAALKIAKEHGVVCILNPAPARAPDAYVLETVDLFTPNEFELMGLEERENVLVTLGARGCLIKSLGKEIPARGVGRAVDTTGAGDTFNGVLAAMLAMGKDIELAAKIAGAVASVGVTRRHAVSSIPTHSEIEKIISEMET